MSGMRGSMAGMRRRGATRSMPGIPVPASPSRGRPGGTGGHAGGPSAPVPGPRPGVPGAPPVEPGLPPPQAGERRRRRLRQEFAVRVTVTSLLLLFNEAVVADHVMSSIIRLTAFIGLVLNVPYYVAIRTGVVLRAQAYVRMLVDVALTTIGLYGAGGLGAAQYIGVYTIVPIYTAFV